MTLASSSVFRASWANNYKFKSRDRALAIDLVKEEIASIRPISNFGQSELCSGQSELCSGQSKLCSGQSKLCSGQSKLCSMVSQNFVLVSQNFVLISQNFVLESQNFVLISQTSFWSEQHFVLVSQNFVLTKTDECRIQCRLNYSNTVTLTSRAK